MRELVELAGATVLAAVLLLLPELRPALLSPLALVAMVQAQTEEQVRQLRRRTAERRWQRSRARMVKAVREHRLAKEALVATELAEMPGLQLLPQTVAELVRMEPQPLPFPLRQTPMQFSIVSPGR